MLEKIPADGSWRQTNYDGSVVLYDSSGKVVAFAMLALTEAPLPMTEVGESPAS